MNPTTNIDPKIVNMVMDQIIVGARIQYTSPFGERVITKLVKPPVEEGSRSGSTFLMDKDGNLIEVPNKYISVIVNGQRRDAVVAFNRKLERITIWIDSNGPMGSVYAKCFLICDID